MVKLRVTTGHLLNLTNRHRLTTSHALHSRHQPGILLRRPHMPRRPIRVTNSQPARQRSIVLLHLYLPTHRPRTVLRLLPQQRDLKHRSHPTLNPHSNRLRRVCPAMRTNILLRSYSHYKPILSNPLHRTNTRGVSLRRILSRQPYINPILRSTLPTPIPHRRPHTSTPHIPTRNRIKQPPRNPIRLRQNPIPPLLHRKRHPRIRINTLPTSLPSPILPQPPRRPGKLHPGQPPSNSTPH